MRGPGAPLTQAAVAHDDGVGDGVAANAGTLSANNRSSEGIAAFTINSSDLLHYIRQY